jgi:hypothetical protein
MLQMLSSMLQTCDVGCCVEEKEEGGLLMFARSMAHNMDRNIGCWTSIRRMTE